MTSSYKYAILPSAERKIYMVTKKLIEKEKIMKYIQLFEIPILYLFLLLFC